MPLCLCFMSDIKLLEDGSSKASYSCVGQGLWWPPTPPPGLHLRTPSSPRRAQGRIPIPSPFPLGFPTAMAPTKPRAPQEGLGNRAQGRPSELLPWRVGWQPSAPPGRTQGR